jgi:hypothetical protein
MDSKDLTEQEQNFVKDILKATGNDVKLASDLSRRLCMNPMEFESLADSIFKKLQNGRVTFDYGENKRI